jgi:hypothetical protein
VSVIDAILVIAFVLVLVLLALAVTLIAGWSLWVMVCWLPRFFPKSKNRFIQTIARLDRLPARRKLLFLFVLAVSAAVLYGLLELVFPGLGASIESLGVAAVWPPRGAGPWPAL